MQAFAKFVKAKDPGVQSRKSIESCGSKEEKEESGGEPDLVHKKRIVSITIGIFFWYSVRMTCR